jgi:hypothetical protein
VFLGKGSQIVKAVGDDVRDVIGVSLMFFFNTFATSSSFIEFGRDSVVLRDDIEEKIEVGICDAGDNTDIFAAFESAGGQLVEVLDQLRDFGQTDIATIQDIFSNDVTSFLETVEKRTGQIEDNANLAYYGGVAVAIGALFTAGIILAWLALDIKIYFCIQTWFVLPVFFIFISFTVVAIAFIGLVLVANADICIGNPSGTPEGLMKVISDQFIVEERAQAAINHYIVDGCAGEYVEFGAIQDVLSELDNAVKQAKDMETLLGENSEVFEVVCNDASAVDSLSSTLGQAVVAFDQVAAFGKNATNLLNCERINELWVDFMHDGVCTSLPTAFSYMFSTMTAIYAAGILIFMFRGALLPSTFESVDDNGETDETFQQEEQAPESHILEKYQVSTDQLCCQG